VLDAFACSVDDGRDQRTQTRKCQRDRAMASWEYPEKRRRRRIVPTLQPWILSLWTMCPAHKTGVGDTTERVGAKLMFLPPYSPDFNPIENAFSKLKAMLRARAERKIDDLWDAVGTLMPASRRKNAKTTLGLLDMTRIDRICSSAVQIQQMRRSPCCAASSAGRPSV